MLGSLTIWVFPKIGVPQNGWLIMENPWMIWGYHYFRKHPYVYQICSNMGPIFSVFTSGGPLSLNMFPLNITFNQYPAKKWTNVPLKGAIHCRTTCNIPFTSCFVDFPRHTLTIFAHSDVHRFSVMVWKLQLELQNICTLKRSPGEGKYSEFTLWRC